MTASPSMSPSMTLGLALDLGSEPAMGPVAAQLRRARPLLETAERAGFDSVWLGESFHARPEPFHLPSALLVLAHLAPLTTLGLGTGVLLVRAQDPDRLATEAALLDQLSEGRLVLGLGLGPPPLRGRFGGPDRAGGALLDTVLAGMRERWRDGGGAVPAPWRAGGPPVLVGGSGAAAVHRAVSAADGYYAATNYSDRVLARQASAYRDAGGTGTVAANRICVVDTDGDRARDHAAQHLGGLRDYYRSRGLWDVGRADGDPDPVLVGTPDEVLSRLRDHRRAGVSQIQVRVAPHPMPAEVARRTVALLGEHVLPRLGALPAGSREHDRSTS
ncbi:LLM class flavin-dependent oxidoreductase [Pseudonocardia sp. ICBG601]|uniref:LLM class flavin-dependent oxidoreductase n=1 Tax=Pseudonocardia sp. ICBG601 TaxID=2846759 RepID=UPI001CF63836|nr:LLM class flavin-dependent oxidoreductase [Pseudonocardia sp. ICBG601]